MNKYIKIKWQFIIRQLCGKGDNNTNILFNVTIHQQMGVLGFPVSTFTGITWQTNLSKRLITDTLCISIITF